MSIIRDFGGAVLIVLNIFTIIFAAIIFAIGGWIIGAPKNFATAVPKFGIDNALLREMLRQENLSIQSGVVLCLLALFIFFVSFLGLWGSLTRSPQMLILYSSLMFLLMCLECLLIYYFTSEVIERRQDFGKKADSLYTHTIQFSFSCCGTSNYTDFSSSTQDTLPWSCCDQGPGDICVNSRAYKQGCTTGVNDWYLSHRLTIYLVLIISHLLLILAALGRRNKYSTHL